MGIDPQPIVQFDFEFHFLHGVAPVFVSVEDGRWSMRQDGSKLMFQRRLEDEVTEEFNIRLDTLAYVKTTKREIPPESKTTDGGQLRVVGATH